MRSWLQRVLLGCVLALGASCGNRGSYISVHGRGSSGGSDASIDGNADDSGAAGKQRRDGSLPDGSLAGSDADGSVTDADGGTNPDALDPASCKLAVDNEAALDVSFADEGEFSLAAGQTGFGLAYVGQDPLKADTVVTMPIASTGPFGKPATLLDQTNQIRQLSLLGTSAGWRLSWVDNFTNSAELHSMLLSDTLTLGANSKRQTLTQNKLFEHFPASALINGQPVVAWIEQDTTNDQRSLWSQRLDGSSQAINLVAASASHAPLRVAVAQMGTTNGAVAWVEEVSKLGIWIQKLDKNALASGTPIRVTDLVSSGSSVDLATREEDGGGIIYSTVVGGTTQEVRFRRLDKTGGFATSDTKIVSQPLQAKDASLARLGGGYAVAYRALPAAGSDVTSPQIRLVFVTKEGNVTRDAAGRLVTYPIAPATPDGGRVTVRRSIDGQLLIAFVNADASGRQLHLVRKRLDCGQ